MYYRNYQRKENIIYLKRKPQIINRLTILIYCLLLLIALSVFNPVKAEETDYYAKSSSEAKLTFSFYTYTSSEPSLELAKILVDKQLTYLFGALSENKIQGVPKRQHKVEIIGVSKVENNFRINYQYEGFVAISQYAGPTYSFYLPLNTETVYERSLVKKNNGDYYFPCTDSEHHEEKYFWYFFNPKKWGCPLVENQDYALVSAKVQKRPNTVETYPEYSRLFHNSTARIDLLMGMNDESESSNPFNSKDIAATNYRQIHNKLVSQGYIPHVWTEEESAKIYQNKWSKKFFVESLVKTANGKTVEVRFFFGPTSTYSSAFHYFYKSALESASIVLYAGHSGLGEYLDLNRVQKLEGFNVTANSDYQIYFFNGCSSYPYYNSQYFDLKGGTKNLDILTNGLATLFSAIVDSSLSLIYAVDQYAFLNRKVSYQSIVDHADSYNLIGINGDEDNN